jgi:hypothetical protein
MSHYDNCRDGYCAVCGAAPGNIFNGVCNICHPGPEVHRPALAKARPRGWTPTKALPAAPAPAPDTHRLDAAIDLLRNDGTAKRAKGPRIDVYWDHLTLEVMVQVNGRVILHNKGCPTIGDARELGLDRQRTLAAAGIDAKLLVHGT